MREGHDRFHVRTKTVEEANMRERDNQCVAIDRSIIVFGGNCVAARRDELHPGAAALLREPNVAHRREFKLAEYNLAAELNVERAGDRIDRSRCAWHDCYFIGMRANQARESSPDFLILLHPEIPRGTFPVPCTEMIGEGLFNRIRERTLRAGVRINLAFEYAESLADFQDFDIRNQYKSLPRSQPNRSN